ncbi:hypothetical protein WCQ02_31325 [Paraburkholderia tropica]|uniref:hypothetical protein n=1 Tax=Paraburkholderia tropica TaxID=92647 RepID=UPI0030173994
MDTKTYGGHTVAALREFLQHGDDTGETIDELTGDDASSANIIRDLLAAFPSDAAGAPIIAWATDDDRVITDRQKQQAIAEGGASASSVKPFSVPLHTAPVAPAAVAPEIAAWQSIETAPKDGRTVLLGYLNEAGKWRTVRGQWMSEAYIAEYWEDPDDVEPGWFETSAEADDVPNCWRVEPTHWMPLPVSPNSAPTPTVAADAAAPKIVAHPGERVSMTYEQYVALRDGSAAQPDERAAPVGRMEMFSGKHGLTWLVDPQSLPAGTHLYARAAAPQAALSDERPAWRDHPAALDAKALATAQEIALMWGQDRSQFVSRIQVAVRDAMDWVRASLANAATDRMSGAARELTADDADMVWHAEDGETFFHTIDEAVDYEVDQAWPTTGPLELKLSLGKSIPPATVRIFNITENGHEWEIIDAARKAEIERSGDKA